MKSTLTRFALLLAFTAVALGTLVALGWRSLGGFELTITRVLREASHSVAEQVAQRLQRDMQSPIFDLLERVDHAALRSFDVPRIAETLREASGQHFELIDIYFVWSLAPGVDSILAEASAEQRVLFYAPNRSQAATTERSPGSAGDHEFFSDPGLARTLLLGAQRGAGVERPFALSYLQFEGRTYQVVYHYLFSSLFESNADTRSVRAVEGFMVDAEELRAGYFAELVSGAHRALEDETTFPPLAISIFNDSGREVSRTGRSLREHYAARVEFPFLFFEPELFDSLSSYRPEIYDWNVRTGYESGDIATIAREQTMPQRLAWGLVSLVAGIGIVLTARSAVREMQVSQLKSEFVDSISHELKTPLAKIQLYADTLRSGHATSKEKLEAYCDVISNQVRGLADLIQGLLDFGKVDAGVQQYDMEELDLRDVLRTTIEAFDYVLWRDGRTTEVVLPETPVRVMGSVSGLRQLFGNLISNALKYSLEERYLRIVLRSKGNSAIIEFTDHGVGIPRSEHRRIFRKFYRVASIAPTVSGSGVGLAIVDHVVRAHHGAVTVACNAGPGSTFTVSLPLAPPPPGTLEARA